MRLPIHHDLQLHIFRPAFGRPLESGNRLIEGIGAGDQWFQVNLAGGNQRQCAIEYVGVAENRLDTAFAEAGCCKVHGDGFRRKATGGTLVDAVVAAEDRTIEVFRQKGLTIRRAER